MCNLQFVTCGFEASGRGLAVTVVLHPLAGVPPVCVHYEMNFDSKNPRVLHSTWSVKRNEILP